MAPAKKKQRLSDSTTAAVEAAPENKSTSAEDTDKPDRPRQSLFIRSLPSSATSESLTALFSESYPIKHATAVIDKETKQCRGFGFVTFVDPEDAQRAKEEFNNHVLEGRKLRIEVAEPRQRSGADANAADSKEKTKVRPEKEIPQQQSRLIVRNLPWTIKTTEQLSKLFMSYGKVKQAYIPKKGPGLLAGFGFVIMRGRKNAEKALEGVNGKEIDGRTIAVDWAVTKDVYEKLQEKEKEPVTEPTETLTQDDGANSDEEDGFNHLEGASDYDDEDGDEDEDEDAEAAGEDDNSDEDMDDEEDEEVDRPDERSTTLFVRNLPFTCTDDDLEDHFSRFGNVRYARVVMDYGTERSKGTGFVCFYQTADADACLRAAPARVTAVSGTKDAPTVSILQNAEADPSGQFTLDGRVLQLARAVEKSEANRLTEEGHAHRNKRDKDKRRLYLLQEGTIPSNTKLWQSLPPSEQKMRDASATQRKTLIQSNPSLHLSLTRLSVRNVPRTVGSKELKQLAREAVVGFAQDVKNETRQKLSKEELARGGDEMREAEKARKKSGKGVVKQAKVVFEGGSGSKVNEDTGAGRSRGYGFIEYYTHRSALMGLRWLNGHAIDYKVQDAKKGKLSREDVQDRKKRLIVEFAIENAQVVQRRKEKEDKARQRSRAVQEGRAEAVTTRDKDPDKKAKSARLRSGSKKDSDKPGLRKRKRQSDAGDAGDAAPSTRKVDERLAKRNQIIGRKRAMRKARKGAK